MISVGAIGKTLGYAIAVPVQFVAAPFVSWFGARKLRGKADALAAGLDTLQKSWEGMDLSFSKEALKAVKPWEIFKNIWSRFFMSGYHGLCKPVKEGKNLIQILNTEGYGALIGSLSEAGLSFGGWCFTAARTIGPWGIGILGFYLAKNAYKDFDSEWWGFTRGHIRGLFFKGFMLVAGGCMAVGGLGAAVAPIVSNLGKCGPGLTALAVIATFCTLGGFVEKYRRGGGHYGRYPELLPPVIGNVVKNYTRRGPSGAEYWA